MQSRIELAFVIRMPSQPLPFPTRMPPARATSEAIPHTLRYMARHPLRDMDSPAATAPVKQELQVNATFQF